MEFFHRLYRYLTILYFLICSANCILGALRPRGVPLSKKVFYNPSQKFSCLDGSGTFPFYFVNDDYCDCADASDEPGTSACPNGLFYCFNLGHKPENIPSSRVNDGICDCCDTSDEYNSTADCFNTCKELGQHALQAALDVYKHFMQGHEIRETYIKAGKEKRDQYKIQLENLKKKESNALTHKLQKQEIKEKCEEKENAYVGWQKKMKEAQEKKIAAERQQLMEQQQQEEFEAKLAFEELDINGDRKLCTTELKSFRRFDYDHDGKVSDKEAMFYMHKKEEMTVEEFLSTGWKIMKPAYTLEKILTTEDFDEATEPDEKNNEQRTAEISSSECNKFEDSSVETSCKQASRISINGEESVESTMDSFDDDLKDKDIIFKEAAVSRKEFAEAIKTLQDIEAEKW